MVVISLYISVRSSLTLADGPVRPGVGESFGFGQTPACRSAVEISTMLSSIESPNRLNFPSTKQQQRRLTSHIQCTSESKHLHVEPRRHARKS